MNATLRPATVEDAPDVAHVLWSSRATFQPYAPSAHPEAEVQRWVRHVLIPSGGVVVASADSRIFGVLAVAVEAGCGWIRQLFLLPGFVGKGVGKRLLEHALSELPRPVRLYTFQANARARAFYERNGFVAVQFSDGSTNEERCPDVLYELATRQQTIA